MAAPDRRESGILLPMTCLPSRFGIGDLGPEAFRFATFLRDAGASLWQVLPLTATDPGCGSSPYSPTSAFAGSPLLISPEALVPMGLLDEGDLSRAPAFPPDRVLYGEVSCFKMELFEKAWRRFERSGGRSRLDAFREREASWLDGYALFATIKGALGGLPWAEWPDGLKRREPGTLASFERGHADEIAFCCFLQWLFAEQMSALRAHMAELGVELVGDVPVYVTQDCADVWQRPELFDLDEDLAPVSVAGVPPDYFSEEGQLWGNPVYDWEAMRETGFQWWIDRLRHLLRSFDRVRIDHFRGLVAYWAVDAGEETAVRGEWRDVPYRELFAKIEEAFPDMPFWAEDLGVLTPEVEDLRTSLGLPGMLILQFAFGSPAHNPYAPHSHSPMSVVYTGTHDNDTTKGWHEGGATAQEKENVSAYVGRELTADEAVMAMIRMALSSVARTAVIPMQDWLGLGSEARVNVPARPFGNWEWRMMPGAASAELAARIRPLVALYGRLEDAPCHD